MNVRQLARDLRAAHKDRGNGYEEEYTLPSGEIILLESRSERTVWEGISTAMTLLPSTSNDGSTGNGTNSVSLSVLPSD